MAKLKSSNFEIGDEVFHIANDEPTKGIVVGKVTRSQLGECEVDWGPNIGTMIHFEYVLRDKFIPKFGVT